MDGADVELTSDDELIDGLARTLGMERLSGDADAELRVGDFEVTLAVALRHGLHTVERSSRDVRSTLGTFSSARDARRFLILELSQSVRSAKRMPVVRHDGFAPGCEVEEAPTEIRLTWPAGTATFGRGQVGRGHAVDFSWVSLAEPTVIAASYGHVNGEPLFDLGIRFESRSAGSDPGPATGRVATAALEPPPTADLARVGDDPALDGLLAELGWARGAVGPSDALAVADDHTGRVISYLQSSYAYASFATGDPAQRTVKATFSDVAAARRFLVLDLAQILRMRRRLPVVRPPAPAAGCTLERGPTGFEVRWDGGSATFGAGPVLRQTAVSFTWVAAATSEEIVASYANADGAPLFTRR